MLSLGLAQPLEANLLTVLFNRFHFNSLHSSNQNLILSNTGFNKGWLFCLFLSRIGIDSKNQIIELEAQKKRQQLITESTSVIE